MEPLANAAVLVTGGTGSFGNRFVEVALRERELRRLVVFSRDELKQSEMQARSSDPGCVSSSGTCGTLTYPLTTAAGLRSHVEHP